MWNHRLVNVSDHPTEDPVIRVCEVYYNNDNEPCGFCDATVQGDSVEEAKKDLEQFKEAFDHPVLIGTLDFNHPFIVKNHGHEPL